MRINTNYKKYTKILNRPFLYFRKSFVFRTQHGYVIIVVLILMLVLVAASYFYAGALLGELTIARNNKAASVAFSLAEAGVQEAIYRVKKSDSIERMQFALQNGFSTFTHDPVPFLTQGGYTVNIQNSGPYVATVISTGIYKTGSRTTKREIHVGIAEASSSYGGGAIFGSGGAGESIADLDFWAAAVNIFKGSIFTNRDINLKFGANLNIESAYTDPLNPKIRIDAVKYGPGDSAKVINQNSDLDCNCLIEDDGDEETLQCDPPPGCTPTKLVSSLGMPQINFDYYKTEASFHSQYYKDQNAFKIDFPKNSSKTYEGVIYVDGSLDLDYDRNMTMKGVLAASGSISITKGQLTIDLGTDGFAGIITQRDFIVGSEGNFNGHGLVYTSDRTEIDSSTNYSMNLLGGIVSRRTWFSGYRSVQITLDPAIMNDTLKDSGTTPVIEINHWEEEY